MAKRKYDYFEVASECEDTFTTESYTEALVEYGKMDCHATIWGFDEEGNSSAIFSK